MMMSERVRPDRLRAAAAVLAVVALACSGGDSPDAAGDGLSGRLTLTGSSTVAPLMSEVGKRFEARNPGVRVDVQTGGSSRGIADAASGLADIGMSSRGLTAEEKVGRLSTVIARDGVAFIVHASNPVADLSDDALRDIFAGKIRNWSQVGGTDQQITVINRAEGRSELKLVTKYLSLETSEIKPQAIAGENQQGIKQVATDPSAITYMSVGTSEFEVSNGTPIKMLGLRGVPASSKSVAAGQFALARPLILITKPEPSALAQALVDFAGSAEVHDLVREHSFVPAGD